MPSNFSRDMRLEMPSWVMEDTVLHIDNVDSNIITVDNGP
jgi:hypothetical protein